MIYRKGSQLVGLEAGNLHPEVVCKVTPRINRFNPMGSATIAAQFGGRYFSSDVYDWSASRCLSLLVPALCDPREMHAYVFVFLLHV